MSGKRAKLLRKKVVEQHGQKQWTAYGDVFGARVNFGLGREYQKAKKEWRLK